MSISIQVVQHDLQREHLESVSCHSDGCLQLAPLARGASLSLKIFQAGSSFVWCSWLKSKASRYQVSVNHKKTLKLTPTLSTLRCPSLQERKTGHTFYQKRVRLWLWRVSDLDNCYFFHVFLLPVLGTAWDKSWDWYTWLTRMIKLFVAMVGPALTPRSTARACSADVDRKTVAPTRNRW